MRNKLPKFRRVFLLPILAAIGLVIGLVGPAAASALVSPGPPAASDSTCSFSFDVATSAASSAVVSIPARCQTGDDLYDLQIHATSFFATAQDRPGSHSVNHVVIYFYNGNGTKVGALDHVTGNVLLSGTGVTPAA